MRGKDTNGFNLSRGRDRATLHRLNVEDNPLGSPEVDITRTALSPEKWFPPEEKQAVAAFLTAH